MVALLIGLIVLGVILLVLEILVLPGMVSGILGIIMIIAGISLSYSTFGTSGGNITLVSSITFTVIAVYASLKSRSWKKFGLHEKIDSHVNDVGLLNLEPGQEGVAISALRPSGTVEINDQRVEAQSQGEWINVNSKVKVIRVLPNKIIVKPVNP